MKSVIRKLFLNFEKEERWLNQMATKGLNFIDYSFGRYLFEQGKPGEYIYRLELLNEIPSHPESQAYIEFMEETGVEYVGKWMRWVYFRRKAEEGSFDLYSDYDSRIKHYTKVAKLVAWIEILNLLVAILNVIIGLIIGHENGIYLNLYFSSVNWMIVIIFTPMLISYMKKIKRMKQQKCIRE